METVEAGIYGQVHIRPASRPASSSEGARSRRLAVHPAQTPRSSHCCLGVCVEIQGLSLVQARCRSGCVPEILDQLTG